MKPLYSRSAGVPNDVASGVALCVFFFFFNSPPLSVMAASFPCPSSENGKWYFTREQIENSPSRRAGLDPDKELSYRQQAANLLQDMGQRLNVYLFLWSGSRFSGAETTRRRFKDCLGNSLSVYEAGLGFINGNKGVIRPPWPL